MRHEVTFIGAGNMGGALLERVCQVVDPNEVILYRTDRAAGEEQCRRLGCTMARSGDDGAREAKYIFLCIKPQVFDHVLRGLLPALRENVAAGGKPVLVSIAAGITVADMQGILKEEGLDWLPIVRAMPNTSVSLGEGVVLLAPDDDVGEGDIQEVGRLLAACGSVHRVTEHELDLGMAIIGCGPAFVYMFIEAMADGGVQIGLPRELAQTWAAQMGMGAAQMVLQTSKHPGELKDAVCSPGGATIMGVSELEKGAFRSLVSQAVVACCEKTEKLRK